MTALDRIAKDLADIGAISLDDFLSSAAAPHTHRPASPAPAPTTDPANAVTHLHQACQRAFRGTDALRFEFIEHAGSSRNKQCILTITKPDGVHRSYATQPVHAKKNEAKLDAAKIAIDMGALNFLAGDSGEARRSRSPSLESSSVQNTTPSDPTSSKTESESFVDTIEKCCLDWRAGRVSPYWVPYFDAKSSHKQGCALRIQLSQHVARVHVSDPTFDTGSDAKEACAKAAVSEGVLEFIKHGNGQTHPSSPTPSTPSTSRSLAPQSAPWTLRAFYDSLPRPFPESFDTNDASPINAPGLLNTMVQNVRGGRLALSFFFTSDGPPGLHGCLLKLDRPGEYKASLVDARFPKRSDAKAAVCLQAMFEGIGDYIRSIKSVLDTKITSTMRSFSSSLVYPALTSELSKIDTDLFPLFEYDKDRDAFGATLVVKLSDMPSSEEVRRYTVRRDYRNKADAKVAVICHAADQGVVEFVRFRGGAPPEGYQSPYVLDAYNPEESRKRKQPGSAEDGEQGRPAKKRMRTKRRSKHRSQGEGKVPTPVGQYVSVHPSGDQIHGISGPGDMGLSQGVPADRLGDPSQPGVGGGGGSGAARFAGTSYNGQMYGSPYPIVLDPRFACGGGPGGHGYGVHAVPDTDTYDGGPHALLEDQLLESGPSRAMPGSSSRAVRRQVQRTELEPGEVVSSAESDFSESSSRNEDVVEAESKPGIDVDGGSKDKGKGKETSPANTFISARAPTPTAKSTHVQKLIDYCAAHGRGTPSFHDAQRHGRFEVWIVVGQERFDLPTTYRSAEEGQQRVARQVLARFCKGSSA